MADPAEKASSDALSFFDCQYVFPLTVLKSTAQAEAMEAATFSFSNTMQIGGMVPVVRFELTTYRLRSGCSTTELNRRLSFKLAS